MPTAKLKGRYDRLFTANDKSRQTPFLLATWVGRCSLQRCEPGKIGGFGYVSVHARIFFGHRTSP